MLVCLFLVASAALEDRSQSYQAAGPKWWQQEGVQRALRLTSAQVQSLESAFQGTLLQRRALGRELESLDRKLQRVILAADADDELKKAKDSLAHSLPGAFESGANAVANFSNVFVYDLGLDYYSRYAEQVNAVTAGQTLEMAKKYMVPGEMVVVAVGDRAKIEPGLRKLNLGAIEIRDAAGSKQ